ncbi:MAG: VirD4-like conjugal transfer protein, CD1115 family, partial [Oscillibacter sp.]
LAPFDIPQLREVMAYDELELDRIGDRKTAVFFIISDTTQTYNFLVALAFSQMFNLLCERADNVHGGRLPHHVRVLWDEAANTGQVPQLEKLVAVIRSREVSLCLLYQQLAQCKAIYDKHAETILGNMDSVVFLGGREASTIKEISENWLGKATISMQTDSRSRGQSESYSQNTQRLGRELMTPAELATMPGDKCILQLRGLPPFFSPKYDLKRHPNYRYTAEADKQKNAFDLDRLINRRRRPGLNEACTMYEVTVPDDALTEEDEDILNYKACADDRVKLQRIRKAVEQGEFDILLVFMYDQLGRNLNETPFIAEWFTKKGIHVWSVYEGEIIDAVDAERMLDYIRFWQTDEAQKL